MARRRLVPAALAPLLSAFPPWLATCSRPKLSFMQRSMFTDDVLANIPAYVINVDRRSDRLQALSNFLFARAPWLGRQTCRVSGPDAKTWGEAALNTTLIDGFVLDAARNRTSNHNFTLGTLLTVGATACIFGHARAWEHVLQQDHPWAIVMEDDVNYLHPQFDAFMRNLSQGNGAALPGTAWDYLNLQPCAPWPDQCQKSSRDADLSVLAADTPCSSMYIITKAGAKRALEGYFPLSEARHTALQLDARNAFIRRNLRSHITCPPAVGQVGSSKDTDVQILGSSTLEVSQATELIRDCSPAAQERMSKPALANPLSAS